jgi:hypothetical protein
MESQYEGKQRVAGVMHFQMYVGDVNDAIVSIFVQNHSKTELHSGSEH